MASDTVLVRDDGAVRSITLNRPDVLNSFNDEMGQALLEALREAAGSPAVRALVLTGAGRGFSAGEDLAPLRGAYERGEAPDLGATLSGRYNPTIQLLRTMPKPAVAAVNGVAAGAGVALALACDIRLAAESARFVQAFVRVGLVPDAGSTYLIPRLIGWARTFHWCATGATVEAAEAERWGLINRVVPADRLLDEASQVAHQIAELPSDSLAELKRLLAAGEENTLEVQLGLEAATQGKLGRGANHMEGVRAFFERRPARFF